MFASGEFMYDTNARTSKITMVIYNFAGGTCSIIAGKRQREVNNLLNNRLDRFGES